MQWLTPAAGLIAAAVTVPILVAMYFLKLRRREVVIPSTFLWKRAVQDLQVNAPFQRLRRNILLLLQLLALAAALLALGSPVLSLQAGKAQRYVLLVDRSASMNATDADSTRLDAAKRQAHKLADSMRRQGVFDLGGESDQAMVIAFDSKAKVMCNFTSDKQLVHAAIDSVTGGDGGSSLAEAVQVARAYAQPPGEDADERSAVPAAQLELFSDGRIADVADVLVREGELRYHCAVESAPAGPCDNVALAAMDARRSYQQPSEVTVFAGLVNYADREVTCDVQLSVDSTVRKVRSVTMPAATADEFGGGARPGRAAVTFELTCPTAGVIEVRQLRSDLLAADDAAWSVLPPPRRLRAALVTDGNLALRVAMKACPLAQLKVMTPGEFDALDAVTVEAFDVVVLDRHAPRKLPRGRYLVFGRPPSPLAAAERKGGEFVVDWIERHPTLEYVNLDNLFAAKHYAIETLPRNARVIAEFSAAPAIVVWRPAGSTLVMANFELDQSNWPYQGQFVMFVLNAVNFLGDEAGGRRPRSLKVNSPITFQAPPTVTQAVVRSPDGEKTELTADAAGVFRYAATGRTGLYRVTMPGEGQRTYAVNLLSAAESDLTPAAEIVLGDQPVTAQLTAPRRHNRQVWPWLVGLALAMVCLEWVVYNAKVRL